ncbi:nedd8-activating enzyme E1 regulatory subunit [Condylostylus longicornis]|uniref:nedd8-activating enzyme E1 regulatory subunit n=1 Tax=Condylostylus longicornis TaxID=2530218 RepID=UPI00244E24A6|nr:nedd8-activating enzyme E1 regulatory subunit [Condylostylus longicornis]
MSSPMSKSPELSDKSKKYDRQIRLWGEHGQSLLENANVCLINATALGCEILKCLILPGVGGFTIVDGNVVTDEDVGTNFFLEPTYVGLPKAKCCMQLLRELNPDVNGDYIDESCDNILLNRPDFFENFSVIVASSLNEKTLLNLSRKLWDLNIPFFYCRSVGFFGSIRLQIKEHTIVETHPDNPQYDLRLEKPFQSLKQHLDAATLSPKMPWLVVLYKFLQEWSKNNDGKMPKTYKEKSELREKIRNAMEKDEENYEEAIKAINSVFGHGQVSSSLLKIFNDDACNNLTKSSTPFWIIVRAIKEFINDDNDDMLPLPGILPDMTADSGSYIALQNLYRHQAMIDAGNVYRRCQELLKELGMPSDTVTEKSARLFCKETIGLTVIRGSKICDEYEKPNRFPSIVQELETPGSLMEHYMALTALEKFTSEHGYTAGECNVEVDIARLKSLAGKMLTELCVHNPLSDDLVHELCRYGGIELHSVAAFLGGCAAQEIIKVITEQYKPIDNCFVYNGITTESATFKL